MTLTRRGQLAVLSVAGAALCSGLFGRSIRDESTHARHLASPTSAPASVEWDKSAKGIKLKYPADWKPKKDPDYELKLLPSSAKPEDRITVDIPDLPPHLAFMIRMGRVEHDYLEDLKKDHPDLQLKKSADANLPDSQARLVESTWHANKHAYDDVALLVIHASSVYIFDAQADESDLPATRAAFDAIRASIQWTKH